MFSQGINWISWLVRYRILLVILMMGTLLSVGWSVDQALSAERTVHLLGCSVVAIYIGFMVPLLTILRISAGVLGFIMVGSLLAAVGMPDLGIENYEGQLVWKGVVNSKNTLGFWSAISVLLFLTLSDSANRLLSKLMCYGLAAVSVVVLIMSDSATSLLAMVVAGSLSLYLYLAFRFQLGFARMTVMAVLFIGLIGLVITNIDTAELLGRSGDLTGRGEVWAQTWKLIIQRPLTGYGYGALWFPNDESLWIQQRYTDFTWVVYHAHNGFLQVASEIGLPLSVIALLMVVQQLIEIFYCQYERQQVGVLFVLAFVITFLISNFSEARFLVNRELYWIFFLALPISMLRQITLVSGNPDDWDNEPQEQQPVTAGRREWAHGGTEAPVAAARVNSLPVASAMSEEEELEDIAHMEEMKDFDLADLEATEGMYDISSTSHADIDLGELITRGEQEDDDVDPHNLLIPPDDDDVTGLDHFDDFDDDHYDRFIDDEK